MPRRERTARPGIGGTARVIAFVPARGAARPVVIGRDNFVGQDNLTETGIARAGELLARFGERRNIPKGESILRAADLGPHLYLVEHGYLEIFRESSGNGCPIASFASGTSFLFDSSEYGLCGCKAATATAAIAVSLDRLDRLAREGLELRLLMYWYRSFDLHAFISTCYPDWDFGCALLQ